jgi:hypothetical protein
MRCKSWNGFSKLDYRHIGRLKKFDLIWVAKNCSMSIAYKPGHRRDEIDANTPICLIKAPPPLKAIVIGSRKLPHKKKLKLGRICLTIEKQLLQKSSMKDPVSAKRRKLDHPHDGDNDAIYVGGSYKSSMFKLQVDEMLAEVQPNYEKRGPVIDEALRTLKGLIEGIEDREGLSVRCKLQCIEASNAFADSRRNEATAKIL